MNLEELQTRIKAGETFDYLFFWGHTAHGTITKACFSQWYPAEFKVDGVVYPTAEHWMMAEKARLFEDDHTLAAILATDKPDVAKKLGRKVSPFDAQKWDERRYDAVVEGNVHKFGQHAELRDFLMSTGDQVLVEASPYDKIWGIGMGDKDPRATSPLTWDGLNLLGFALMDVRDQLR
ncbi:MAG: NADAR family protein [bacterium]